MRLEGKRALVTGSSQGIGAEVARLFAREGATVAVNHRGGPPHREAVLRTIEGAGGNAFVVHADVSDSSSVDAMFEEVRRKLGGLDILVNAAGLADPKLWNLRLEDTTLEMWKRVFAVDTFGTFLCVRGAVRLMKQGSSIVNVASIPALVGDTDGLIYASAKGAVVSMTKMLAKMLAPKVRVNCMAFGSIETAWVEWLGREQRRSYVGAIPMGRFGKPSEAASLALFLASEESSFITGQVVSLDGGEAAR
ncbi:MAG: SDR family oxidoreductase [Nitrososphaerota archaeon]|nr:SDR family oxidoreductase [Nitrososphaerota archaeon]MCL5672202.1 SDR family oxidoreductase [Nitrososphaerota archaeon]MDG6903524.1 SDR family oxidoreductase [Nitrososphaerota archaeon]MDG6912113.1 SDR family oxidoreductase [Nitrososphaerota archaeon]MDG6924733.1 SDR family oxidoreductase [Nitrososphaerota archaeon]